MRCSARAQGLVPVENTRRQVTDYDRLALRVTTNGALTPEDAVALAARILQESAAAVHQFPKSAPPLGQTSARASCRSTEPLRKVDELELSGALGQTA